MPIEDERGRLVATGEMPDFGHGLDHALALLRPTLQRILWSSLEAQAGVVRFGCDVRTVDTATGEVEVSSADRTSRLGAEVVVGSGLSTICS